MARGSAMDRTRGRERSRGAQTYTREQAGRDPARSDDARDGWLCGCCSLAEGGRLAGHPGHRHHLARSRCQRPREIEFRGAIRTGQGEVPAGRPGGAHPPPGAQQARGHGRAVSSSGTKELCGEVNDDNVVMRQKGLVLLGEVDVLTAEEAAEGCGTAAAVRADIHLREPGTRVLAAGEATR